VARSDTFVTDAEDVLAAAIGRADAMASQDEHHLWELLHPSFCWVSHKGDWFDLKSYLESNRGGSNKWHGQVLHDPDVHRPATAGLILMPTGLSNWGWRVRG
jgi:hypothetical protein